MTYTECIQRLQERKSLIMQFTSLLSDELVELDMAMQALEGLKEVSMIMARSGVDNHYWDGFSSCLGQIEEKIEYLEEEELEDE